jgi:anti-anti-sigma factor
VVVSHDGSTSPKLAFEWDQRIVIAALAGEIDLAHTDSFLQSIVEATAARPLGVVLDLSDVSYLDSAGVRLLFLARRNLERKRIPVVAVLPTRPVVRRILLLAEVPTVLPLSDTRTEAVAHIKLDKAAATAAQLQHALDSRVIIEQAKGILAERHAVDLEEAFERMRTLSRRSRRTVREIAAAVVSGSMDVPA